MPDVDDDERRAVELDKAKRDKLGRARAPRDRARASRMEGCDIMFSRDDLGVGGRSVEAMGSRSRWSSLADARR